MTTRTTTTASTKTKKTSLPSILARRLPDATLKIDTTLFTAFETAKSGQRKRKLDHPTLSQLLQKKLRLSLPTDEKETQRLPPTTWPTSALLRRLWQYCHQRRPDLISALTTGVIKAQQLKGQSLSENEIVAAVMEHLVRSWGPAVLGQVYWAAGSMILEEEEEEQNTTMAPTQQTAVKEPVCIDLTIDDEDDKEPEASPESCREGSESSLVPTATMPATTDHEKIEPLEELATVATLIVPTDTALSPVPDVVQFAIAYGFDMARRYQSNGPSPALWQEAARTVRFMSPQDRKRIWKEWALQARKAAE
eukprot:scaffold13509_cov157-Amphora_coffeaeformis.AAC.5